MSETELPQLDAATRDLLRRVSGYRPVASAGVKARVLSGVEAAVGPQGGGPAGGLRGLGTLQRFWSLVASFVLGGAAGAIAMHVLESRPPPPEPIVVVERPPAAPAASPSAVSTAAPATAVPETSPSASASSSSAPRTPSPPAPARDVGAEQQILDVARHALDQQNGTAAMAAIHEHERRYPNGVLVQEREAMAIRALLLLGRDGDARARADRFRAHYPGSVLLPAIEAAVGTDGPP